MDPDRPHPTRRVVSIVLGLTVVALLLAGLWPALPDVTDGADLATMGATESHTSDPPTSFTASTTTTTTMTTTTTTTVPPPTTPATPASTGLTLRGNGLGVVELGTGVDETLAAVTEVLGRPTGDSGWVGARTRFGTCPGTVVRVVSWDSLRLFFGDGPTEFADQGRHFYYWIQTVAEVERILALTTPEGIGLGSTGGDLRDAYGSRLAIENRIGVDISFMIRTGFGPIAGTLTDSSPRGQVTSLSGGFGCGG